MPINLTAEQQEKFKRRTGHFYGDFKPETDKQKYEKIRSAALLNLIQGKATPADSTVLRTTGDIKTPKTPVGRRPSPAYSDSLAASKERRAQGKPLTYADITRLRMAGLLKEDKPLRSSQALTDSTAAITLREMEGKSDLEKIRAHAKTKKALAGTKGPTVLEILEKTTAKTTGTESIDFQIEDREADLREIEEENKLIPNVLLKTDPTLKSLREQKRAYNKILRKGHVIISEKGEDAEFDIPDKQLINDLVSAEIDSLGIQPEDLDDPGIFKQVQDIVNRARRRLGIQ